MQLLIELRYWESMTTAEIAEVVAIPHPTVRSRLGRALERLEQALAQLGASPARIHSTRDDLEHWAQRLRQQHQTP
jgi:RNA polymerase sigma-70 factor (ECF subfamily)